MVSFLSKLKKKEYKEKKKATTSDARCALLVLVPSAKPGQDLDAAGLVLLPGPSDESRVPGDD